MTSLGIHGSVPLTGRQRQRHAKLVMEVTFAISSSGTWEPHRRTLRLIPVDAVARVLLRKQLHTEAAAVLTHGRFQGRRYSGTNCKSKKRKRQPGFAPGVNGVFGLIPISSLSAMKVMGKGDSTMVLLLHELSDPHGNATESG